MTWIFPPLVSDRVAAGRARVRAWICLGAQPSVLQQNAVLAVDAPAGRRRLLDRGAADGLGLSCEAAAEAFV